MFIQAVDNKLYENPIIEGKDFIITAQDIEDPEISIKLAKSIEGTRRNAYARLKEIGIIGRLDGAKKRSKLTVKEEGSPQIDLFCFPSDWKLLLKGCRWGLEIKSKIPIPNGFKSKVDYPRSDSKFLAFELEFPIEEVRAYLNHGGFNSLLLTFLMGKEIYSMTQLSLRQKRTIDTFLECLLKRSTGTTIIVNKKDY